MEGKTEMSTNIRPTVSRKNDYYIDKHRFYELKHFCLQYSVWKRNYVLLSGLSRGSANEIGIFNYGLKLNSPTENCAIAKKRYLDNMELVENACEYADRDLRSYILEAVTKGRSYTYLSTVLGIPCSRDTYYDRYRKFFWILSKLKE